MKVATIFRAGFLVVSMICGIAFDRVTNRQYTKEEIRQRIEKRIDTMRKAVDDVHGEGYFDRISTGDITKEELERSGISLFHVSNVDSYDED